MWYELRDVLGEVVFSTRNEEEANDCFNAPELEAVYLIKCELIHSHIAASEMDLCSRA